MKNKNLIGEVEDNGMIHVPDSVYKDMGLKPGSKVRFYSVDSLIKKANPKIFSILHSIHSAKRKPSRKDINSAILKVRGEMQAEKSNKS